MTGRGSGRSVTSRALQVLECFESCHTRLSLSDIARRSGLPLPTAHRLTGELETWGAVTREDDGTYVIGARLWNLGLLSPVHAELREAAAPFLTDVYEMAKDNVHLAVRDGHETLYVEKIAGRRSMQLLSRNGVRLPLHATGVGKVLLAHAPAAVVRAVFAGLTAQTPLTITDPVRLAGELAAVRSRGYATTVGEMSPGASSIAVPVHGPDGCVVASIGIVTSADHRQLPRFAPLLRAAAAGLSRCLPATVGAGSLDSHRLSPAV